MHAREFVEKWRTGAPAYDLGERAGAQSRFIDLCHVLGVPEPDDPERYCFERGLTKTGSAAGRKDGFADVWLRGHFAWEYYAFKTHPVLEPLDHIECRDAVLNADGTESRWPKADAVVGNPPFVGNKKMRVELGDAYTEALRAAYFGRVPGEADLVCYWFERARSQIGSGQLSLAGLVATNSIRGGANREVLDRVTSTTPIFVAWSDEPWVNEGAAVRVSLIAFGAASGCTLDGKPVHRITSDLTDSGVGSDLDLTRSRRLPTNLATSFQGTSKVGPFEVSRDVAVLWLMTPNVNGKSNADVIRPWVNGQDLVRRPSGL